MLHVPLHPFTLDVSSSSDTKVNILKTQQYFDKYSNKNCQLEQYLFIFLFKYVVKWLKSLEHLHIPDGNGLKSVILMK